MKNDNIKNIQLTEKQQIVINKEVYPDYLISCAGTGKTEIIIRKIAKLVERQVPLSQVALITFTNKAASEMKSRLSTILYEKYLTSNDAFLRSQIDYLGFCGISTIHSFCQKLLKNHGLQINVAPNFSVSNYTLEEKNIILDELIKQYNSNKTSLIPSYKLVELIKELHGANAEKGANFEEDNFWTDNENDKLSNIKQTLKEVYKNFEEALQKDKLKNNVLTPNDLIKYSVLLMKDEETSILIANETKYVFVDEFQDTDREQYNLFNLMIKRGINVFVAGDQNQSIYGFRGAKAENFTQIINLVNDYSENQVFNENFRTDSNLLQNINLIFNSKLVYNGNKLVFNHTSLKSSIAGGVKNPLTCILNTRVSMVAKLAHSDVGTYTGTAVLCRTNQDLIECEADLKNANIPYMVYGGKSFYKSAYVVDVCKLLKALLLSSQLTKTEILYTEFAVSVKMYGEKAFEDILVELNYSIREYSISNFLNYLYEKTCIIKYLQEQNNLQEVANLFKLVDISRNYNEALYQTINFVSFLDAMITTGSDEEQAIIPFNQIKNAVTILTIHKAKGLAFDNVIIPNIDKNLDRKNLRPKILFGSNEKLGIDCENIFGKKDANVVDSIYEKQLIEKKHQEMEEELRILFVAMTRAKKRIYLTSKNAIDKILYKMKVDKYYTSYFSWLNEIQNGKFINKIIKSLPNL